MPRNPDLGSDAGRVQKEEQKKIDEAEPLTEDEISEKESLLNEVPESFVILNNINFVDQGFLIQKILGLLRYKEK